MRSRRRREVDLPFGPQAPPGRIHAGHSHEPRTHILESRQRGARHHVTSGNFLEMFDFFLYGFYAKYIAAAFFPTKNDVTSLLLTFMTFGAGFLMWRSASSCSAPMWTRSGGGKG